MSLTTGKTALRRGPARAILLTTALCLGLVGWQQADPEGVAALLGHAQRPTEVESSGVRLSAPTLTAPTDRNFAFIATQPGTDRPVAFDPCRPVHYVVRPSGTIPEGDALIADAFAQITAASGLVFVADGATDEKPGQPRPNYQPDRYGDRWAPVLLAWSGPQEVAGLSGDVVGLTSSQPVAVEGDQLALVSGQVVLDSQQLIDVLRFNGGRAVAVATISHELGHLVGLGHVDDPRQLMYPQARTLVSSFGNGDLTGLAELGRGTCFDQL